MSNWIEYSRMAAEEALQQVECPACGDAWYLDLEPDTGRPYTCFCCGNGTHKWRAYQVEEYYLQREADERTDNALNLIEQEPYEDPAALESWLTRVA